MHPAVTAQPFIRSAGAATAHRPSQRASSRPLINQTGSSSWAAAQPWRHRWRGDIEALVLQVGLDGVAQTRFVIDQHSRARRQGRFKTGFALMPCPQKKAL